MSSGEAQEPDLAEDAKARGDECFREKNYKGALSEYNAVIEGLGDGVQSADYYIARGKILEILNRHDEAWSDLLTALQITKKAVLYGDLADTYHELDDHCMAEKYYKMAILMDSFEEKYKKGLEAVQGNK